MKSVLTILTLIALTSCAHVNKDKTLNNIQDTDKLLSLSKTAFENAYFSKSRNEKILNSKKGIIFADECANKSPRNAGCYYYRALNTGLYYEAHIIGYQKGIKKMINDCKTVIDINPDFDNAGAYLVLGQIYSQVPITAARQGDIKRDLELANEYLSKAISIAPNYPENLLYYSNVQLELGELEIANKYLNKGMKLMNSMKESPYYQSWKKLANDIKKELRKNGIN